MKFIFGMQINIEVFCKLILLFWVCVARHAQITQNSMFAIRLQYLKENLEDEVDFLPAYNHQRFLKIDTIIDTIIRCVLPGTPKLPKITSLLFPYNILRKKWVLKLIFCMQMSMKVSDKFDFMIFDGDGHTFPK